MLRMADVELDLDLSPELGDSVESASRRRERQVADALVPELELRGSVHPVSNPLKTDDEAENVYGSVEESFARGDSSRRSQTPEYPGFGAK